MMTLERIAPVLLIVDDDAATRLMVGAALEQHGFRIIEAENGEQALAQFAQFKPNAVLLDVVMPGMDGYAACRALRESPDGQHVPIMMMTGLDDTSSIDTAYDAGATDFLTKPVNFGVLPYRIRYMLRGARITSELRDSQHRLEAAQRLAKLGHFEWHQDQGSYVCSGETQRLLGIAASGTVATLSDLFLRVHIEERLTVEAAIMDAMQRLEDWQVSCRVHTPDGAIRHLVIEGNCTKDTELVLSGVIQDVTERRKLLGLAHRLAYFDPLTGLPNRTTLRRLLGETLVTSARDREFVAVLSLDLDNFKRVNDTLGRDAGDRVLKKIAERLCACVGYDINSHATPPELQLRTASVARTGADEFYAVIPGLRAIEDAAPRARRVLEAINKPVTIDKSEVTLSATVGISVCPEDGTTADELIERADAAKNHAKAEGRDHYQFYTAAINVRAFERLSIESHLRKAIQAEQFELYYQPKIEIWSGRVVGAEALIRWRHPDLGMVPPSSFIPIAEDTGLILPLGEWIIDAAWRDLISWHTQHNLDLHVAVNISALQFRSPNLLDVLREAMAASRLPASTLEIELTESLLMDNSERSVAILDQLRGLGVGVWIDDFGTGYSSLSYLRKFPLSGVKIDQSFVREMDTNENDNAIVGAVIALAHSLDLSVVAEGVEQAAHLEKLEQLRCQFAQGYLFSRPLPAREFVEWVESRNAARARAAALTVAPPRIKAKD